MPTPSPAPGRVMSDFTLDILCKDAPGVLQVRHPASPRRIFSYSSNVEPRAAERSCLRKSRLSRLTDAAPPAALGAQKISATVTAAGFNIGTIATSPCPEHAALGTITVSLADALFARPARRAATRARKKKEKAEEKKRKRNNVVAASRAVGFIETRDATLRKSLERLPEVIEVSVAEEPVSLSGVPVAETTTGGDTGLLYLVHDFKSAAAWEMGPSYDELPLDPYLEGIGAGRFRAYSKFAYVFPGPTAAVAAHVARLREDAERTLLPNGERFFSPTDEDEAARRWYRGGDAFGSGALVEVPDPAFNQPDGYSFEGREDGVTETQKDRTFPRLPRSLVRRPEFKEILARFASYARLDPRYSAAPTMTLGAHAIRIKADEGSGLRGQVVPEGMHQDGFEYISLLSPQKHNVEDDWRTYVYVGGPRGEKPDDDAAAKKRPIFSSAVEPGAMLFVDDRRMWHDADDLRQADKTAPGWRDFMVITLAAADNEAA